MKVDKFIEVLNKEVEESSLSFISNMNNLNVDNKTFCEWIEIYISWMEWKKDDCESYYFSSYLK